MSSDTKNALPSSLNAALLLADGTVFKGFSFGAPGPAYGEVCFNTAMTGYQEVLTDPSYNGQVITFTFPHIGNVGCNEQDIESGFTRGQQAEPALSQRSDAHREDRSPNGGQEKNSGGAGLGAARPPHEDARSPNGGQYIRHLGASGLIVREPVTEPSNFRSGGHLDAWLKARGIAGIHGVDTRALTRHIRKNGAQNVAIVPLAGLEEAKKTLAAHPSLKGLDLAARVTTPKSYEWTEPRWSLAGAPARDSNYPYHVVAIDYGEKLNILRCLASLGCRVTVLPGTSTAKDVLALKPDGVFLSNGPGDPAATGAYAVPVIRELMQEELPLFGICLGHQMLAIAMGGATEKMHQGHRGANHPVRDLETGKVEITSQNHGFVVSETLPADVVVTHRSLFDGTIQGLRHKSKPVFCVQGHPEASPGPHDSLYLFERFVKMMEKRT